MSVVTEALKQLEWRDKHVLVGCSGGVDSMVLLDALVKIGVRPEVLHVDYGLRGSESDADRELVAETAERLGLKAHIHRCDPGALEGTNLQAAARAFRRRLFADWTARSEKHIVALAHHADDQVETFFLQLLRGSGTFGLGGMHPARNGIVRPFLELPKAALREFAEENEIAWRDDASNAGSYYLRNRFRNEWLPALSQEIPGLDESVLLLMRLLRDRQTELRASVATPVRRWKEKGELEVFDWQCLSAEERIAFVHGAGLPLWTSERFQQLAEGRRGAGFLIGEERIERTDGGLMRKLPVPQLPIWDFKTEEVGILPIGFDKQVLYLDGAKVRGELRLRTPGTGDRIRGVGMKGSQLVSDVLKDAGIPLPERRHVPLLVDDAGVLWIPGIKVGRTAVAGPSSQTILKVTVGRR